MSKSILPMFSSRSFIVSGLTFKSSTLFELSFVYSMRKCFVSVLFSHWVVSDSLRPMDCRMPSYSVLHYLLGFAQTHVHWGSNAIYLTLCHSLLCLQSFSTSVSFPVIRLPKYWSFSLINSPSNEYSGLISFRMDWLDFLAVPGILKSLLQHHSSKASVLQCSAFFMVHFSHLHMTTRKTIGLTRWTFASKVMSLLFDMLSRFVIAFLPRRKHLLISWLQSLSTVILEPKKIKSVTASTFPLLFAMK